MSSRRTSTATLASSARGVAHVESAMASRKVILSAERSSTPTRSAAIPGAPPSRITSSMPSCRRRSAPIPASARGTRRTRARHQVVGATMGRADTGVSRQMDLRRHQRAGDVREARGGTPSCSNCASGPPSRRAISHDERDGILGTRDADLRGGPNDRGPQDVLGGGEAARCTRCCWRGSSTPQAAIHHGRRRDRARAHAALRPDHDDGVIARGLPGARMGHDEHRGEPRSARPHGLRHPSTRSRSINTGTSTRRPRDVRQEDAAVRRPGGADSIAALCWRTILMTDQDKRTVRRARRLHLFPGVPRWDAGCTGAGLACRRTRVRGASSRPGRPTTTGEERRLRLIAVAPWVTVEQVLDECGHKPTVADAVGTMGVPTDDELDMLRSQLDVVSQFSGARGGWIIWDGEKYVRQEQE